ncbi:MAG: hypothetical protein GEU83_03115 [Pseudonocardiaceae bacterium]|nr:hypothetical protein [Pseudonocardiaceae bacterium]
MSNVWTVIISAVAALSGVSLGQWLQARRDTVQYQRERERETRQWYREDIHRFTSEKRSAYAEFLSALEMCERCLDHLAQAEDRGPVPAELRLSERYLPHVTKQHEDEYEAVDRRLNDLCVYLRLIAPDDVSDLSESIAELWWEVGDDAMHGRSPESLNTFRAMRRKLTIAMTADLEGQLYSNSDHSLGR